jgi:multidrug efflux pump subunit AcrB
MAHPESDATRIEGIRNLSRFFTENRHIAWVLLIATLLWGIYAYREMPQRKDPEIPVRVAVAITPWPGASAQKVEELVTQKVEERVAENLRVEKLTSVSRSGVSVVLIELHEKVVDSGKEFDDIQLKLDDIQDLPEGAGPIRFLKDYGATAALMLTVASPEASDIEVSLRAHQIRQAIERVRAQAPSGAQMAPRVTIAVSLPEAMGPEGVERRLAYLARYMTEQGFARDIRPLAGPGFAGLDAAMDHDDAAILAFLQAFVEERLHTGELHPDVWPAALIRDPADTETRLAAVAGDRYSYRQLDDFTDLIKKTLQTLPQVSKVDRYGVLEERVFLEYSQERLASYGLQLTALDRLLKAHNTLLPGGRLEVGDKRITIDPTTEFKDEKAIGDVLVATSPAYLRDLVETVRGYESPPEFLNFLTWRDAQGRWQRTRAITLSIQMRGGEQIGAFGEAVDAALHDLKRRLPEDLLLVRTSDQPRQVAEKVDLFMLSLYEAIALVVLVAFIGFREWRSALLMAVSIPLTLALAFGMMHLLGIDLQQVSLASLIIALGLLVDDPVVAGDAIKRELAAGRPRLVAAWWGPTRLSRAILFATLTNIVAYLPLLIVSGDMGRFIYSLAVVMACALVASRIVSMTFVPLLGYYLLRPAQLPEAPLEERRTRGFIGYYYRLGEWAIGHRWAVFLGSLAFLGAGAYFMAHIKTQFFPKDLSYLSYVEIWLPEDAPLVATDRSVRHAEDIIRQVADHYGREHVGEDGRPRQVLKSITSFVGGGGPRFWFSVDPELQQPNYAQVILEVNDKHDTYPLATPLQKALSAGIVGARVDVRLLESGEPVGIPVSIRLSGHDIPTLRDLAQELKALFRAIPEADRVRDDWGAESFAVRLKLDPDRASLAGITSLDVARASSASLSGFPLTTLREGDRQIPVLGRLRVEERAALADLQNLYVYALEGAQKVPLRQVSSIEYSLKTEKIRRRHQFRTLTVSCFPVPGVLPSQVLAAARPQLAAFEQRLPPGYRLAIGGEQEKQSKRFGELAVVMAVSIALIFVALTLQFRHALKPFIVFAAIPYGVVGALGALALMGAPFGFMAFLGIASLVGVIVSHVIVLFDFIEDRHGRGSPLHEALLDAGIVRLRPVLVTVGATVFALVPLALHGGPLWEPLCYAQIGGLALASVVTLLLVPVLYAIFVLDLKLVRWELGPGDASSGEDDAGVAAGGPA